jgi:hypothetical protein
MARTVRNRNRRSARSTQSRRRKIVGGDLLKFVGVLMLISAISSLTLLIRALRPTTNPEMEIIKMLKREFNVRGRLDMRMDGNYIYILIIRKTEKRSLKDWTLILQQKADLS